MVKIYGRVSSVNRRNELERLEIWVGKKGAQRFLNQDGMRVPVPLLIGSQEYVGGIRFTHRNKYIWICPNLMDKIGHEVSLVNALKSAGLKKNDKVFIRVEDWKVSIISAKPIIKEGTTES